MASASILIVDDNPVNLRVLRAFLNRADYEVIAAENGQSALSILKANPTFDLVLLNAMMPDIDGIEVCRRLKADPETAHIPILLVSSHGIEEGNIALGLQAGADGYLTQPVEEVALRAWVKATLHMSRLHRDLQEGVPAPDTGQREVLERFSKLSHHINNPLQVVYATAELLLLELGANHSCADLINEILKQVEQVARMVAEESMRAKQMLSH